MFPIYRSVIRHRSSSTKVRLSEVTAVCEEIQQPTSRPAGLRSTSLVVFPESSEARGVETIEDILTLGLGTLPTAQ